MPSPFMLDLPVYDRQQIFRVSSYTIGDSSTWTTENYDLTLDHDLVANYFVMFYPTADTTGATGPAPMACRVTRDPFGTGDLDVSVSARTLRLRREGTSVAWRGTILVIECLKPDHASGFQLSTVKTMSLTAHGSAGVQDATTPSGVTYSSQIVPFGGVFAGGLSCSQTANDRWPSVRSRVRFTSDALIHLRRWDNGTGTVQAADATIYLVKWGTNWTVQNAVVNGTAGGTDLNVTGEFANAAISSVVRLRSWLFSTAITPNPLPTGWVLSTLGDGVNENASESQVSAGPWLNDNVEAECWVMTHSGLSVDWQRMSSTSVIDPFSFTVPVPKREEGTRTVGWPSYIGGRRLPVLSFAAESTTSGAESEALIYPVLVSDSLLHVWRRDDASPNNVTAWVQLVDFGAIVETTELETTDYGGPIQGIILPDLELTASSISSVSSRGSFRLGPVTPASYNSGRMFAFHSGDPSADMTLTYRITRHGDLGSAGWIFQEEGGSYWYGWNAYDFLHGSHLINDQTSARYGLVACYSSVYDRIITGYFNASTDTTLNVYYNSQDGDPFTYTSLGSLELLTDFTTPVPGDNANLRMIELDDGSLRLLVAVIDEDGNYDFDVYSSVDGGDSWTLIATRIIWRAREGTAMSYQPVSVSFAVSGDWLRVVWVDGTLEDIYTLVSSSRGTSWEYLGVGASAISTNSNGFTIDRYALTIVGRPDGAGTFILWVRDATNDYEVDAYTATRNEEWTQDTDLDFNLTSGREVEHLAAAYTPDGIFLVALVVQSSALEISYRLRVYDVDDPQGVQATVGTVSIKGPGIEIRPFHLTLMDGGRELLMAWNAMNFAGASTAGMGLARLAGWSQVPVQSTSLDRSINSQTWTSLWADSPSGGSYAFWPRFQSGATFSSTRRRLNVQTSSAGQYGYWEFSPSTTGQWNANGMENGMSCGGLLKVVTSAGEAADSNIGVKVRAQGSGSTGVAFMLTASTTEFSLWDLISGGGTKIAYIGASTLATSWWEFRLGLLNNNDVFMAARPYEGSTWEARGEGWSRVSGSLVMTSGITLDLLQIGHQTYSGSGTNESEWREFWVSDSYGNNLQQADLTWPMLSGRITTSRPQRTYSGVDVFWGGSGAARKDTFTGEVNSAYPAEAMFVDSPRYYWESSSNGAQTVVLDFGAGSADEASMRRTFHEACFLLGTRSRTATVEYSQTNSWSDPVASYELDATIRTDIRVLAVDGHAALVEYEDTADSAASLAGMYLRITAASTADAVGKTWKIRKHGAATTEAGTARAWMYLESESNTQSLSSYMIMAGDTACAFADRMSLLYGEPVKTRYMRISFPLENLAPINKHALAGIVAGPFLQFDPPMDWTWKDNEQPNTTRFSSKSGVTWARKEGPAQRVWQARLVGDQAQRAREAYRDMLKLFADYDRRPVVLLTQIDGRTPPPRSCLYGYVSTGGQLDNEGWWRDAAGYWRPAGDLSFQLEEVV